MGDKTVLIGNSKVGDNQPCYLIAEIGINHNGNVNIAKELIKRASYAGWDAVKFQKRTIQVVYTEKELATPRESPFGDTNGDLKQALEFGNEEYKEIARYCREIGIDWFASCWDEGAVDFIEQFNPIAYKIPSACITNTKLLAHHKKYNRPIILSTGMSDYAIIDRAVQILGKENLIILHCTSTYPSAVEELNLRAIDTLKKRYRVPIGYSGHEVGVYTSYAAAVLGACIVERHITLDRAMWGSDHAASLEANGFIRLAEDVKLLPVVMGDGEKRIYDSEVRIAAKLRRI